MSKFNVGDVVYIAAYRHVQKTVPCPDCLGSKKVRVILADDTIVAIDCPGCVRGWEPPDGVIYVQECEPIAELHRIEGVREERQVGKIEVRYTGNDCRVFYEEFTFATKEEAMVKALEMKQEHEAEVNCLAFVKTKQYKSWAYNVSHFRKMAQKAQAEMERYLEKVEVCGKYVKEEKHDIGA